jgi:queuine tRNA-ribosyltransferase
MEPSILKMKNGKIILKVIDSDNYSFVDVNYSKAYLRHLFSTKEALGRQIATIHNLSFYLWLVKEARNKIIDGTFKDWKVGMVKRMNKRL